MNITMAKSAGFCFGVKRAIRLALEAAAQGDVCSLGPLIHNQREVERLSGLGVHWAEDISGLSSETVIIRSHGVPPEVTATLAEKGFRIIDATCPFVKKAQNIAASSRKNADIIVIVGDKNHPEVKGLMGYAGDKVLVVNSLEEAKTQHFEGCVAILSQTTQSQEVFSAVVEYIKTRTDQVIVYNTICKATAERQNEVAAIAKKSDLVLVVGGKNSANTAKLAAIAAANGAKTAVVEHVSDIENLIFKGAQNIGITAGASTPDWIIVEVLEKMKEDSEMEEKVLNVETEMKEEAVAEAKVTPDADGNWKYTFEKLPAYTEDGKERCLACQHCMMICPKGALSFGGLNPEESSEVVHGNSDDMLGIIKSRRSVRSYKKAAVPEEKVEKIKEMLAYPPTGGNMPNLHFSIVGSPEKMDEIRRATYDAVSNLTEDSPMFQMKAFLEGSLAMGNDMVYRGAPSMVVAA